MFYSLKFLTKLNEVCSDIILTISDNYKLKEKKCFPLIKSKLKILRISLHWGYNRNQNFTYSEITFVEFLYCLKCGKYILFLQSSNYLDTLAQCKCS